MDNRDGRAFLSVTARRSLFSQACWIRQLYTYQLDGPYSRWKLYWYCPDGNVSPVSHSKRLRLSLVYLASDGVAPLQLKCKTGVVQDVLLTLVADSFSQFISLHRAYNPWCCFHFWSRDSGQLTKLEDLWVYSSALTGNISESEDWGAYSSWLTGSIPSEM
jgi:hypothetical protein